MESFLPYLLSLLLLPLSLYLVWMIRRKDRRNLPPGSRGWPILGDDVELAMLGSKKFIENRMQKYSHEVFQTPLLGEKMAVLCGAEGNKFVFTNENKLVSSWFPRSLMNVVFPGFEQSRDVKPLTTARSINHEVLKPDALKQFLPVMDSLARELLERDWRPNPEVKVFPFSRKYTLRLAFRVFLSVADTEVVDRLMDPFDMLSDGNVSLPINLPGTAFNRAIKGAKVVREEMMRIIEERRREMMMTESKESEGQGQGRGRGRDLLSKLLLATDEDGNHLSDAMVANNLVGFLLASQATNSAAITAIMHFLSQLPHIYDEVFKEQMEIAKSKGRDEVLTWEDVEKMKYSWNVARETLRLIPPARGTFRKTTAEFTYAGFTIPKGWKIFWTVHSSHKNPAYFPEPEKFDPSRFEGSGPPPYTFIPFGGGPRMCPGRGYAKLVMLVLMHNVVTRFRLEKLIPDEEIFFHVTPTPAHGLPLHLHPHHKY
ncbi:hypothetical protein C2S52_014238 [Perilla frutescens var. hirtella]|nr:hypothetical protein C2S52_014238 [Perilla frutescens var. hirtella]